MFVEPAHTDRIHAMVKEFHKNYKPDFAVHPLLEQTQTNLLSIVKNAFTNLRFDFEDQKKLCVLFKFKEKRLLEEINRLNAAKAANLGELIVLRTDSLKTKNQLAASQKALEEERKRNKTLTESS